MVEPLPQPTRFLLVRHGQSTWNAIGRWQGRADAPLSPVGEDQAREAAVELAALGPFGVVVTSSLARARRTGELLADHAGIELGDAVDDLIERSAGQWEGLLRSEIEARYPNWLAQRRRPPGYESDEEIATRAVRSLRVLAERHAGVSVVVVSHGGLITSLERAAGEEWRQLANLEARWFEFDAASGDLLPAGALLLGHAMASLLYGLSGADGVSFLTPYGDAPIGPDSLIDISHEALIRCWQKIADEKEGWLQREFQDRLIWQSLRIQAGEFAKNREQVLSPAATADRDRWLKTLPGKSWTERYDGGWHDALAHAARVGALNV